ncbi:MAG TPA: DUF5916 domain-containing protein [Pyrinomonadaceae bacterium]|jgi:hypothetical protein
MIQRVLAFVLTLSGAAVAPAQTSPAGVSPRAAAAASRVVLPPEKAQPARAARLERAPVIDGRIDEGEWQEALVLKDFYQTQPGDNIPPSRPTEVLLGYDATHLYLAFRAHDEPDKVRATIARRDDIFSDDHVGVYLDTHNDRRKAYALYFNPLGVQADSIYTEGRGEDFSVDVVMTSKGLVTPDGYTVEVAVPFKSLRYEAGPGKLWGLHAIRVIQRFNNEQNSWMPISRDDSGFLSQGGHLSGIEQTWAGRSVEVIPTLTFAETGRRVRTVPPAVLAADPLRREPGRFVNEPLKVDPGVTARLAVAPSVTLDFTVNPDFAQVEADALVVTANQRFPIFFEEKRPFFLEGIDIFQTPLTAVHTRTIVDPDAAAKLTGKRGRNTFGILLASDRAPGNFSEDERTEIRENTERYVADRLRPPAARLGVPFDNRARLLDRNAAVGVLRLKRDVGAENSLGLIATTYNFVDLHNHLGGFDGRFRLGPQTVLNFHVLATHTRGFFYDPALNRTAYRTGNGFGYYWDYSKSARRFGLNLNGLGFTRDYRAKVGFTRRPNTNRTALFARQNSEPDPKAALTSWRVTYTSFADYDWQRRLQLWLTAAQVRFDFKRQSYFNAGANTGAERVFEEEFGPKRTANRAGAFAGDDPERTTHFRNLFVRAGTTPNKKYSAFVRVSHTWGELDFDAGGGPRFPRVSPGALRNPRAPRDPGPGNFLDVSANFTLQPTDALRASLDYTRSRLRRYDTGRVAFDDNIYALRATYQFTRFTFARARVDYDTLDANVRGQFLFGWTPNPGTAFYAGYNEDTNRNGFNPFTGEPEPGLRRNDRTFFLKLSYLFRRNL